MEYINIEKGVKINRLTLTGNKEVRKIGGYDNIFVEAICECGTIKYYRLSLIKKGRIKSCGCLNKERQQEKKIF